MSLDFGQYNDFCDLKCVWKLTDKRYEEIKEIVVTTFEKYSVNCVPVSGFELATKMGITVVPYSAKNTETQDKCLKLSEDGFSVLMNEKWFIFYNDNRDYGRINNTMLHEIGHIVLNHSENSELAENEAKFFAKYALVPPVLVLKLGLTSPEEIATVFAVSYQAACFSWDYYQKWLNRSSTFTMYEIRLIDLFDKALSGGGATCSLS